MYGQKIYRFSIDLSAAQLLEIYRGSVHRVRVRTFEGLVLDLDAERFKPFTTREGIQGTFTLTVSGENRFVSLVKLN